MSKERSVRFSTKKPIEHESFDYGDDGNTDFEKLMRMPPPALIEDKKFDQLDMCTAASLGWEFVEKIASTSVECSVKKNIAEWSPLMYAAYLGHVQVCEFLCSKGAPLEDKNELGQTALMLAASCGSKDMVVFLVNRGAEVNCQDKSGRSSLHYATQYNQSTITEVLAKAGGDPNLADKNGMTPMLNACKVGNDATVSLLFEYKGDPNRTNYAGENGEALAAEQPNVLKALQSQLTMNDVLRQLGLEKYIPIFEKSDITLNVFLNLKEKDLTELGITLFGPKKKLLNVIQQYKENGIIATEQDVVISQPQLEIPPRSRENSYNNLKNFNNHSENNKISTINTVDLQNQITVNSEVQAFLFKLMESKKIDDQTTMKCQNLIQRISAATDRLNFH
uniref:SAM domain-containing protein n=1 Tax=Panagrolaimus superbus TaxID=310955 RepID=A0A914YUG1_9BILA